jgi:elongation factor Ts
MFRFIESYVHNGRIGVLVEFGVSMDITARTAECSNMARNIAMHIAAANPSNIEELMKQPYVKDITVHVEQYLSRASAELGEKIEITRFVRWDDEPERPDTPPKRPAVAMRAAK